MKKSMLAIVFGSALVLAACGGGDENSSGSTSTQSKGEKVVKTSCATCHGGDLQGMGNTPSLNDVGSRLTEAEILDVIKNGKTGGMPSGLISGADAEEAAKWLAEQK